MPEKPAKFLPALYGGIIMGVLSGVPGLSLVNCLCCAGIMFGGFMAVFFYKKELQPSHPPLTNGDALGLGAISGLIGAVVTTLLSALFTHLLGFAMGGGMERLRNMGALSDQIPPETLKMIQSLTSGGALLGIGFVFHLVIMPLFGLLGGLIGYSVFKPKAPAVMPPPPPPAH
ncbi:MAG TPA: hypothetical protein VL221_04905 [Bacteroidota bacterium]|nr:hypothetical protein [Bacteroidota bacterium]